MNPKKGRIVPTMGTLVPKVGRKNRRTLIYASMVADALRQEFHGRRGTIKTVMQWTGASERTVKHWLAGSRGPSGEHLVALAKHSEAIVMGFFLLSGHPRGIAGERLIEARQKLNELASLLGCRGDAGAPVTDQDGAMSGDDSTE